LKEFEQETPKSFGLPLSVVIAIGSSTRLLYLSNFGLFVKRFQNPSQLFDGDIQTWHILKAHREIPTFHWETIH
jgi:hypothetical protein